MPEIIPSIIAFSKEDFLSKLRLVEPYVRKVHLDVMDGNFVAAKTVDFEILKGLKTRVKIEAHLMIEEPWAYVKEYALYCDTVLFHWEACKDEKELMGTIIRIREKKKKVGIVLNPDTQVSMIKKIIPLVDQVLIMTVMPGSYGAPLVREALEKIKQVRKISHRLNIETDGAMKVGTARIAAMKGADMIVAGSAIMLSDNPKKAIKALRDDVKLSSRG